MNSQRDAVHFVTRFQEYARENETNLFFNLYKSKVERISNNSKYKQYNTFNNANAKATQPRFQKYNEFPNQQPVNMRTILII